MAIRVLIVDDSVLFRTKLQFSLNEDKDITVVGSAINAVEAMLMIEELRPDVVTLDVEMPQMSGLDLLKKLIPKNPVPVVVVSSLPINALEALDAGAVDFVKKPSSGQGNSLNLFFDDLKAKVKIASTAKVRKPVKTNASLVSTLSSFASKTIYNKNSIIAIGASTGGTEAIIEVVKDLPETTPGIVIVQHMPEVFTKLYAQRLDKICKMRVKEAEDLDRVKPGHIIIGAGKFHLMLKKDLNGYFVRSQEGPKVSGHCPSVDVLFDSVAATAGRNAIGVILTGMGADGAKGIKKMHDSGCFTIGQDKDSCVVYGMPMEAFKLGAISRQYPLDKIGDEIMYHLNRTAKNNN